MPVKSLEFLAKLVRQRQEEIKKRQKEMLEKAQAHKCRSTKESYEFFLDLHIKNERAFEADKELYNILHQIDLCIKDSE